MVEVPWDDPWGEYTINEDEIKEIIGSYFAQWYVNEIDNLSEMEEYLQKYKLSRLREEEIKI